MLGWGIILLCLGKWDQGEVLGWVHVRYISVSLYVYLFSFLFFFLCLFLEQLFHFSLETWIFYLPMTSVDNSKANGVTMVSWNVRGLRHFLKRTKVSAHLKSMHSNVVFLQETHIRSSDWARLRCSWAGHIFQATFSSKVHGGSIIIKRIIPFQHHQTISDINGRFLIVFSLISARFFS